MKSSPVAFAALAVAVSLAFGGPSRADHEKKTPPSESDWRAAPELALARPSKACTAKRLDGWLRLDCLPDDWVFHVRLLAGRAEGVVLEAKPHRGATILLPTEKGDRRSIALNRLADRSSYSVIEETAAVVSETWIDGEDAPTVVVD